MKKQQKQLLVAAICAVVLVIAYFGVKSYNAQQEEAEAAQTAADTISIVAVPEADITAFSFVGSGGDANGDGGGELLSFTKDGDAWTCDNDRSLDIDEDVVSSMLSPLASLTADGVLGDGNTADTAEYGFDAPVNVITFTTAAGKTTLTLGMENPVTGQYYLQKDGGGEIYLIPSTLEAGFATTLDEMVKAE